MRKKPTRTMACKPMPKPDMPLKSSSYQPTKAELEEDVSIRATPYELLLAVLGRHPKKKD